MERCIFMTENRTVDTRNQMRERIRSACSRHSADALIPYKEVSSEQLMLAVYYPEGYDPKQKYPLFCMIHGGAWCNRKIFPDQDQWSGDYLGYLARYYSDRGFLAVSVEYRLARNFGQTEGYGLPELRDDCCDALNYLVDHSLQLGIDLSRVYLLGESAGGYLAASLVTSYTNRDFSFRKAFLINPITDVSQPPWMEYVPRGGLPTEQSDIAWASRAKALSPVWQITEDTCTTILVHGKDDKTVNPENSVRFYEEMCRAGNSCSLLLLENTTHAFLLMEYYKGGPEACERTISEIDREVDS